MDKPTRSSCVLGFLSATYLSVVAGGRQRVLHIPAAGAAAAAARAVLRYRGWHVRRVHGDPVPGVEQREVVVIRPVPLADAHPASVREERRAARLPAPREVLLVAGQVLGAAGRDAAGAHRERGTE